MEKKVFKGDFAGQEITIETGELAQQAGGSCLVRYGDTVVLGSATMGGIREGINFFPLSVEYEERLYAAGKIKGSRWIKREGRPTDEAVLTSRLIDRCIRPLFSKEIKNEVQVVTTVLSFDQENDSDIVSLIAASCALAISEIPWAGPLGGVRLGQVDGEWIVNPTFTQREKSDLDLIVSGMNDKVLMIEAGANEVKEELVYNGIALSLKHIENIIKLINEVVKAVGKPKAELVKPVETEEETPEAKKEVVDKTTAWIKENVPAIIFDKTLPTKKSRLKALAVAEENLMKYLESQNIGKDRRKKASPILSAFIESEVTRAILNEDKRVDGRGIDQIRQLTAQVGILPRTHGTGLFNRGETQVLSIVTLGAPGDEQSLDGMEETGKKRFMHHYNFPPYSVGETGRIGSPGRREIGHGALAEKALKPMIPSKEEFPYTIRVVSEVLGSNGSSSMGSTCGSTLALMDAGVPIKKPVAGIAMGCASDEEKGQFKVITDLQDLEDGVGGMDFKIAGTRDGITAIQLDTKTKGLPLSVMKQTLEQGLTARLQVLDVMASAIKEPRPELSAYAPRIISFKIDTEKIRDVIGPGGKVINKIIEETGVQIDIEQDGSVFITGADEAMATKAQEWIKNIVKVVEVGEVYDGKVSRLFEFGAMVEFLPGQEGMVHISEMAYTRVGKVTDVVQIGDAVKVKVIEIDDKGRVNLSMKALLPRPEGYVEQERRPRPPKRPMRKRF